MFKTQTDYWKEIKENIQYSQNRLPFEDFAKELDQVYTRKLEIIEEILIDLAPEADDEQYTETTSWKYEDELKELDAKQAKLEPIVEDLAEKKEHEDLLKDLGWTQEQFDEHNRQLAEDRKKRRAKRK